MLEIFTIYIYQPFFNILVGIYWLLSQVMETPDMGIAVIIFALIVRIIMLPLSITSDRSAAEKAGLSEKIAQAKKEFAHDPVRLKLEQKKILKSSPGAIISETFIIIVQLVIILMLYRIFKTGLEGADIHLLYSFMPNVPLPINLLFLGQFDLSQPNLVLNLFQSFAIFVLEAFSLFFSVQPISRHEFLSLTIFMPIASFVIFSLLPAGKKLFIITTLTFSLVELLVKQLLFWYHTYLAPSPKQS